MPPITEVTDATFAGEIEGHQGLALVDFWATWCGPCKMLAPVVEQVAAERAGTLKVAKLDIDANQRTTMRFNVRGAPTLLLFKDGALAARIVGAVPKRRIDEVLAQYA